MSPNRSPSVGLGLAMFIGAAAATPWLAGAARVNRAASPAMYERPLRQSSPILDDLAFIAGHWDAEFEGARLEEHFATPSRGSMIGMFRWTNEEGTRFTEHMVIEEREDGIHFFLRHFHPGAVPWEQERNGPAHFRLDSVREQRAVFSNLDSETTFPQRFIYHRTHPHELVVRLEGRSEGGETREMQFNFRRHGMTTTTETLTSAGKQLGYDGGLTISFQVSDVKKSIDWYQNVLGFKLLYHIEEMGWCELTTGVERVAIGLSQVEEPKTAGPVPTFGVRDIDAARATLEKKGVKFDGPTQVIPDMVKLATFYDPDGNSLMLYQALSDQVP